MQAGLQYPSGVGAFVPDAVAPIKYFGDTDGITYPNAGTYSFINDSYDGIALYASRVVPISNEIRPVNKAVKYIKHTALTLANIPTTPNAPVNYRYIAKVRY